MGLLVGLLMAVREEVCFTLATLVGSLPRVSSDMCLHVSDLLEFSKAFVIRADDNLFSLHLSLMPLNLRYMSARIVCTRTGLCKSIYLNRSTKD